MKNASILAMLAAGLLAMAVMAQTPAIPPAPASPPVPPEEPAAAKPAVPATPATPPAPATPPVAGVPGAGKGAAAVGKLFRTERQKNDRGQFTWVCTYNVEGTKRAVALDESCPSELTFEVKH